MVPLNVFSTVTVYGLVFKDGVSIPQTFERGISRHGRTCNFQLKNFIRPDGFPERPPSNLPLPGNEHLYVALGETLGSGRIGTVYQATLITHNTDLPQLTIKISRQNRSAHMEQEAWFYEELEQVQGIAVPRCYGLFQVHIDEGTEVSTWNDEKRKSGDESDGSNESDRRSFSRTNDSEGEKVPHMPTPDPTLLSVLLIERLGERIPVGECLDHIHTDVREIFNDLSRLGIEHLDIRWSNILSIIQDPNHETSASGTVCPNHGHAHQWRVIDFDLARKTNGTIVYMDKCAKSWLVRLFMNLPVGRVLEPWE